MEKLILGNLTQRKIGYGIVQPGNNIYSGVHVIKVYNIMAGLTKLSDLDLTTTEIEEKYSRTRLKGGELIVSIVGTIGKTAIVPKEFAGCNIVRAIALIDIKEEFLSLWTKYYIDSPKGQEYIKGNLNTTVQPTLNIKSLSNMPIPFYGTVYTKKAVNILSTIDNKIQLNKQINENLEQQAQALFKSWFVDFEPFKDGKFIDSELGRMPKGWKVGTIGDYCKIRSGFAFKSSWWTGEGVKIVKIKNISSSGILNMDDCSYVSKVNTLKAKEFSLKSGDILIAMTGATIGKFCLVPALKEEMYVNQRVGKFFLGENPIMKIPFIYGLLKCENIISQIINKGQGSAQPNISGNDIETVPIIYPPEDIISKYNELVSPYFSMIIENISACDFVSQLRDTLLPRLMSGELQI